MNKKPQTQGINSKGPIVKKRPRNYNFTLQEKMHFLDILQNYIEITESRRLDSPMVYQKRKIWDAMSLKYNKMFPLGPQRDSVQLKDLYRRMKIYAKKVHRQRHDGLQDNETPLVSDEATERLIEMINSPSFCPSNISVEDGDGFDDDSYNEDVKPIILHPLAEDSCQTILVAQGNLDSPGEEDNVTNGSVNVKIRKSMTNQKSSSVLSYSLPSDVEITPISLPVHTLPTSFPEIITGSDFSIDSQTEDDLEPIEIIHDDNEISSKQLNKELLKMAHKEHLMKMKIHQASLELLQLQKWKLLKEIGDQ